MGSPKNKEDVLGAPWISVKLVSLIQLFWSNSNLLGNLMGKIRTIWKYMFRKTQEELKMFIYPWSTPPEARRVKRGVLYMIFILKGATICLSEVTNCWKYCRLGLTTIEAF